MSTSLRPRGRGAVLVLLALVLWLLGDLTQLPTARTLAAAMLLTVLLALLAALLMARGLRVRRALGAETVEAGSTVELETTLDRRSLWRRLPLGRGEIRCALPADLGGEARIPLRHRSVLLLTAGRRGLHELGAVRLVVDDLLGCWRLQRRVHDGLRLTVLPRLAPPGPAARRAHGLAGAADPGRAPRPEVAELGPIPRPYVAGDELRRIHWRASARAGMLMTREEEDAEAPRAVILLDTRRGAEDPGRAGPARDRDDRLVDHAASLLAALSEEGWAVRVIAADGEEIARLDGAPGASRAARCDGPGWPGRCTSPCSPWPGWVSRTTRSPIRAAWTTPPARPPWLSPSDATRGIPSPGSSWTA